MRDVERRLRSAEAEYQRMAEANEQLSAAKRALEAEKEELEELRGKVRKIFEIKRDYVI